MRVLESPGRRGWFFDGSRGGLVAGPAKLLCERALAGKSKVQVHSRTDPDLFVRVVASTAVSYRSYTVRNTLSHVFNFRVLVPIDAIPVSGVGLYVQDDDGQGTDESQENIGALRLTRQQLLGALQGDGLLHFDDPQGGLQRIEIVVSLAPEPRQFTQYLDMAATHAVQLRDVEVNAGEVLNITATGEYLVGDKPMTPAGDALTRAGNFSTEPFKSWPHGAGWLVAGLHGQITQVLVDPCADYLFHAPGAILVGINDTNGLVVVRGRRKHVDARNLRDSGKVTFVIEARPPTAAEWTRGRPDRRCSTPAMPTEKPGRPTVLPLAKP